MIRQLSVFVENKPGSFRQVTTALHEMGAKIYAFCSVDSPEFGILRVIVDQPEEAERALVQQGFMVKNYDVIAVKVQEQQTINQLLDACCESNISINYTYSSFGSIEGSSAMVFHCEYLEETESMLKGKGFECLNTQNLR